MEKTTAREAGGDDAAIEQGDLLTTMMLMRLMVSPLRFCNAAAAPVLRAALEASDVHRGAPFEEREVQKSEVKLDERKGKKMMLRFLLFASVKGWQKTDLFHLSTLFFRNFRALIDDVAVRVER